MTLACDVHMYRGMTHAEIGQDGRSEVLRRVCAWCQRVLAEGSPGARTTHGICNECADMMPRGKEDQMKKLSSRAETVLGVIRESTVIDDGEVERYWVPGVDPIYTVYGGCLERPTYISGSGDARIIRSLEMRGLVRMRPVCGPYACECTEDGVLEYERIAERKRGEQR